MIHKQRLAIRGMGEKDLKNGKGLQKPDWDEML
jgi:hypothetical protein